MTSGKPQYQIGQYQIGQYQIGQYQIGQYQIGLSGKEHLPDLGVCMPITQWAGTAAAS